MFLLHSCKELDRCLGEACSAIAESRRIRQAQDVSFQEDVRLSREEHARLYGVIKHLLVGHEGQPCPAGGRPIVSEMKRWEDSPWVMDAKPRKPCRAYARHRERAQANGAALCSTRVGRSDN
jgi:hypothetical protein